MLDASIHSGVFEALAAFPASYGLCGSCLSAQAPLQPVRTLACVERKTSALALHLNCLTGQSIYTPSAASILNATHVGKIRN